MGASQMVSMRETWDVGWVGYILRLLSTMLSSNDVQPCMVMALLWTPLLCGEQIDCRLAVPGGHQNAQPS